MDKGKVVYIFSLKKDILLFVTAWMDLDTMMLSEICQTEREKRHMVSLI